MINMNVKDYRITSDERNIIVNKLRRDEQGDVRIVTDKDGTERESMAFVGYYGTLETALTGIVRDYTLSDEVTIKNVRDYKKACEDIVSAFKKEIELGVGIDD